MQGILKKLALASAVLAFAVPAPAFAQGSVQGGYNESDVVDPGGPVDPGDPAQSASGTGSNSSNSHPSNSSNSGGSLPFTGLDIGLLAAAGAGLVALGFGMRRLTRNADVA